MNNKRLLEIKQYNDLIINYFLNEESNYTFSFITYDEVKEDIQEELEIEEDYLEYNEFLEKVRNRYKEENEYERYEYYNSKTWKQRRNLCVIRDKYKCRLCDNKAVDVHHLSYDRLGTKAEIIDCISLCRSCHNKIHKNGFTSSIYINLNCNNIFKKIKDEIKNGKQTIRKRN